MSPPCCQGSVLPASCLHALPQVPQQRDLNWLSWQSFSCFTFSQYLVVSLHSMFSHGVMLQRCQLVGRGPQEHRCSGTALLVRACTHSTRRDWKP